jgi:hypothetical protein
MMVSSDGLEEMFDNLLLDVGAKASARGVYGGASLFYCVPKKRNRSVEYYLGKSVLKNLGDMTTDNAPYLGQVRTLNGVLAFIPLDIGLKHFRRSGDPRVAALYLAEAVDHINADLLIGDDVSLDCGCDESMSSTMFHHCNSCQRLRLCASLVLHGNARVCKRCEPLLSAGRPDDTVQAVMEESLRSNHAKECKLLGKDPKSETEMIRLDHMVKKFLDNYLEDGIYTDDYAIDTPRQVRSDKVRVHRDPFICSVDATEPYGESHDKAMRVHTENNVAMSTSANNYLKQRHLLGYLVELHNYGCSASHSQLERDEFEKICNDLYIIACKTPFTKKARIRGRDLQDLEADQAEWRAGVPVDGETGPWDNTLWRWFPQGVVATRPEWSSDAIKRLSHIVDQIEVKYNVRLQRAADNAPWPRKDGSSIQDMPPFLPLPLSS